MDLMRRSRRRFAVACYLVCFLAIVTIGWLVMHPETIGEFFGRIIAGVRGGARG